MLDWDKLHKIVKIKEIDNLIEKDGTASEYTAFRCAFYLMDLEKIALIAFYVGMNFTNIKNSMEHIPTSVTTMAQYLYNAMTEEQLSELEKVLIPIAILNDVEDK